MDKIVFVYGSWCSYCKDMDRVLDQIPNVEVVRVNVETEQDYLYQYLSDGQIVIESVPFTIFESDGLVIDTHAGPMTTQEILAVFNK